MNTKLKLALVLSLGVGAIHYLAHQYYPSITSDHNLQVIYVGATLIVTLFLWEYFIRDKIK